MTFSLVDTPATARDRHFATAVAIVLAAITVATLPFASHPLPAMPSFMPAFAAVASFANLLTAYILLSQARTTGARPILWLGTCYLFTGLIIVPHMLTFPGLVPGTLAASSAPVWLWIFWHWGFSLGVLAYALAPYRRAPARRMTWLLAAAILGTSVLVAALTGLALSSLLPPLIFHGNFADFTYSPFAPALIATTGVAGLALVTRTRLNTIVHLWLAIATVNLFLDIVLTLYSLQRYSLGWYVARLDTVGASVAMLAAFLYQLTRIQHQLVVSRAALAHAHAEQRTLNQQLEQLAKQDALTGLLNRRGIREVLEHEWSRWLRYQRPFSVLMIDLDHFKAVNDLYGHAAGDVVLEQVAALVREQLRRADVAGRYGGEEFLVLLPETTAEGARCVADLLRSRIRECRTTPHEIAITASIGISATGPQYLTLEALLDAADVACYRAKNAGRNRVVAASDALAPGP